MLISQIVDKNNLKGKEVDIIINMVMSNASLFELTDEVNKSLISRKADTLSSKEIYSVASIVCKEAIGERIMIVAPRMFNNKKDMVSANEDEYKAERNLNNLISHLNFTLEDLISLNEESNTL